MAVAEVVAVTKVVVGAVAVVVAVTEAGAVSEVVAVTEVGAGAVAGAELVKCLPTMHQALGLVPNIA